MESERTPLLMISHGELLEKHAIYNLSEQRFTELNISALDGKKVMVSIYGWLVLVEPVECDYGDCCLFNPITDDVIDLPRLHDSLSYTQCILTKPPTEPDCYILFNGLEQSFCRIGDKEYVTRTLMQQDKEEVANGRLGFDDLMAIASFQGKTYGFMDPDKFVTINFVGKTIEFMHIPMEELRVSPHPTISHDIWLIEPERSCGGEPLMVQKIYKEVYCYEGLDFKVFRIDIDQMKCIEMIDIGDRTIFVSEEGAGYCCGPCAGIKQNSIYYTNEEEGDLYVYDLEVFDVEERSTNLMLPSEAVASDHPVITSWIPYHMFS